MSNDQVTIQVLGGSLRHEHLDGLYIRALQNILPPYFCHRVGGSSVWEHYAVGSELGVYIHLGRCDDIPHEHGAPHDHGLDENPL